MIITFKDFSFAVQESLQAVIYLQRLSIILYIHGILHQNFCHGVAGLFYGLRAVLFLPDGIQYLKHSFIVLYIFRAFLFIQSHQVSSFNYLVLAVLKITQLLKTLNSSFILPQLRLLNRFHILHIRNQ